MGTSGKHRFELWASEEQGSLQLLWDGDERNKAQLPFDAKVIFSCTADTYEEAKQQQHDFLGWEPYDSGGTTWEYPTDQSAT